MADTTESPVTHFVSPLRWAALKREFLSRQAAPSAASDDDRR
ncbi:MAG TPA: hypothetical protein VLO00_07705 [Cryobacterium sp.]|nr:hypothetical protein [Cryobacterium sp.]